MIRDFSSQSGDLFVSYQFTLLSGAVNNNDFASLWFETNQFPNGPNIGFKGNSATNTASNPDLFTRTRGGAEVYGAPNVITGETYFLVGHLFKSGGSANYDRFSLWINPEFEDSGSPLATSSTDSGFASVANLGWRLVNLDIDDEVLINDLTLGSSWGDVVSAIPEPSTYALILSIGALVFVVFIKRVSFLKSNQRH